MNLVPTLVLLVAVSTAAAPTPVPLPAPTAPPGAAAPPQAAPAPAPTRRPYDPELVKRGEYLVRLGGCGDCHTPVKLDPALGMPVPDLARAFSGHPAGAPDPAGKHVQPDIAVIGPTFTSFALPFGIVYASNISSDRTTGIGAWTEQTFIRSMRTGKRGGAGRPILPPMPWMNLLGATDDDLRAMFAYLQSTPPIKNAVPRPGVPPEVLQQMGAAYDKLLGAAGQPPGVPPAEPPPRRKP
jgi:hypothetical protein